jgi:23S rRNA pseudouridine1911/1915/1917 synthase
MLNILYEDDALIFVNKEPGIVVQRGYDPDEPILYDLVSAHTTPLFLMQRLDRGTSGVMFFSKRADVNPRLTRHFELKRINKKYLALCEGMLEQRQTIDAPLRRVGPISFGVREDGKRAITDVMPLHATPTGSFLELLLRTGRTHQIRSHMAAIGHPLAGDWLYGQRNAARPMLHAAELALLHPLTNQPLRVTAPLPADFEEEARRRGIVTARGQTDPSGLQLNY